MREIGISPRFSRDKFVPLQTKQRYSTRDISGEVFLTLFFRGFVPFLSLADFVSRDKNLQVVDLQRLKSYLRGSITATTSNHQKGPHPAQPHTGRTWRKNRCETLTDLQTGKWTMLPYPLHYKPCVPCIGIHHGHTRFGDCGKVALW